MRRRTLTSLRPAGLCERNHRHMRGILHTRTDKALVHGQYLEGKTTKTKTKTGGDGTERLPNFYKDTVPTIEESALWDFQRGDRKFLVKVLRKGTAECYQRTGDRYVEDNVEVTGGKWNI